MAYHTLLGTCFLHERHKHQVNGTAVRIDRIDLEVRISEHQYHQGSINNRIQNMIEVLSYPEDGAKVMTMVRDTMQCNDTGMSYLQLDAITSMANGMSTRKERNKSGRDHLVTPITRHECVLNQLP